MPRATAFMPFDFTSYPYSHSLVAELMWGALLVMLSFTLRRDGRAVFVVALSVPSHWLLDFIVHRPDMPIFPGGPRYGLGLWNSVPATLVVETVFLRDRNCDLSGLRLRPAAARYEDARNNGPRYLTHRPLGRLADRHRTVV
jgi:hypothetical protein